MGFFDFLKKKKLSKVEKITNETKQDSQEDINKLMTEQQEKYLATHDNTHYDFFGTFGFREDELPFFEEHLDTKDSDITYAEMFIPYTPRLLTFCVHRLTNAAVLEQDLDCFKQNCEKIANASKFKTENDFNGWKQTINRLCDFIYEKKKLIADSPDLSLFTEADWKNLGKTLKQYHCLPPSYSTTPTNITIVTDEKDIKWANLKFNSTTSSSYRIFMLSDSDAYMFVNNENQCKRDSELSIRWNNYKWAMSSVLKHRKNYQKKVETEDDNQK